MLAKIIQPGHGFKTFHTKNHITDKFTTKGFHLNDYDKIIANMPNDISCYEAQNVFNTYVRQKVTLMLMTHSYVDLDIYNVYDSSIPKINIVFDIKEALQASGHPEPTYYVDSGRGMYLIWAFNHLLSSKAINKYEALNKRLVEVLEGFGADSKAVDATRILRLMGSFNPKSQSFVEPIEETGETYSFDYLCDQYFLYKPKPKPQEKIKPTIIKPNKVVILSHEQHKKAVKKIERKVGWQSYHWGRAGDIAQYIQNKFEGAPVPEGERDLFAFFGSNEIANALRDTPNVDLFREIQTWTRINVGVEYANSKEYESNMSSVKSRFKLHQEGKRSKINDEDKSKTYTYKTATILEKLKCDPSELKDFNYLVDKETKKENDAAKKREKRGNSREEWKKQVFEGSAKQLKPWEKLGIGRSKYYNLKKAGKLPENKEIFAV